MAYYSAIKWKTVESVLMRWMNLELFKQSEVGQKEKDKYCILRHIYRIQKNGTEEFTYRATVEKQTQRIDLWTWGEGRRGEGEVYGKNNMETYVTLCKIDSQQEFAVWLRKQTGALYYPRGVGWDGRWEGASKGSGYMYTYDYSC